MSNNTDLTIDDLTYEWPPNVGSYEAKLFAGLTWIDAIVMTLGFLIPIGALQMPLPAGLLGAILGFLVVKKFERFGGISLPFYLFYRLQAARSNELIELPLITSGIHGVVEIEDYEGVTVAVIE